MAWELLQHRTRIRKTLAEWGIQGATKKTSSAAQDEFSFAISGVAIDSSPVFEDGDEISVFLPSGVRWFFGVRISLESTGSGNSEAQNYRFAGPWYYLDQLVYQQIWTAWIGGVLVQQFTPHVILNLLGGTLLSAEWLIKDVLGYAKNQGAKLAIGTIQANVYPPPSEEIAVTCANVIRRMLGWSPANVCWFDYTTDPPTFHCRPRGSIAAQTVQLSAIENLEIRPRHDLLIPEVVITYEVQATEDGEVKFGIVTDRAPATATGRALSAMVAVVNVQGVNLTTLQGDLEVDDIGIDVGSIDWWKHVVPWLGDVRIRNIKISAVIRSGSLNLPRRIIAGTAADWMTNGGGSPVQFESERITAELRFETWDDKTNTWLHTKDREYLSVDLTTTDAPSGITHFQTVDTAEPGDPIPSGLAAYLLAQVSVLHYDGKCKFVAEELGFDSVAIGSALNIAGGKGEWAGMNALIQQISEVIDTGEKEVTFGPPAHLGIPDLVELLKVGRIRKRWTRSASQTDGEEGSGNPVTLGKGTANDNGQKGAAQLERMTVGGGATIVQDGPQRFVRIEQGTRRIWLNIDDLSASGAPSDITAQFRLTDVCENGITTQCLVLRTQTWPK